MAPISTVFFVGFPGGQIAGKEPVPDYLVIVSANETQLVIGMLIELIYALAVVGIIVNLFPILKKHDEASASLQIFGTKLPEIAWVPIGVQEMVFSIWLIVKGVDASAIASDPA